MINILEQIHAIGYVYNDLNLENILIDCKKDAKQDMTTSNDIFDMYNITLVDMSFATLYLKEQTKQHLSKKTLESYRGSVLFSSLNQLNFYMTSRRDDLISLLYLMVYLFGEGNLPGIELIEECDPNEMFE